jgi:hypothetical protein
MAVYVPKPRRCRFLQVSGLILIVVGSCLVLIFPTVLLYQIYFWLKYGHWTAMTLWDAYLWTELTFPSTSWVGVDKVTSWIFGFPLSLTAAVIGPIIIGIGATLEHWCDA